MRKIKFRAWDKEFEKMTVSMTIQELLHEATPLRKVHEKDYVWMQFTGLHDKNKNPIYEGDILTFIEPEIDGKQTEFGCVVVKFGEYDTTDIECGDVSIGWYVEGYHGYSRMDGSKDKYEKLDSLLTCQQSRWRTGWEIIGNIYENPELLSEPTVS